MPEMEYCSILQEQYFMEQILWDFEKIGTREQQNKEQGMMK
jgi:hypothetical protein